MVALALRRFPPLTSVLSLGLALARIAGVSLVAIGISGALALAAGSAFGKDFVSGDLPGVTYTPARCAELLEYHPAPTCAGAATAHHFDEVVSYRLGAGLLGLLVIAADRILVPGGLRRRARPLPAGIVDAVGATAFGISAAALLGLGLSHMVLIRPALAISASGSGQWLSGGLVAAPIAAFFALRVLAFVEQSRPSPEAGEPRLR